MEHGQTSNKMRNKHLHTIAIFLITLVITIPLYSSPVLAALSDGHVYGETDKIRDYTRRNENIYLNITAQISGDTQITPSQLHRGDLSTPSFNTCAAKGDGSFYCSYQMSSSSLTQNPYQLRVRLYNDNDVLNDEFTINSAFDELPPEIKSFTITPSIISQGNINFQYNVYDHSYSSTDSNRCSGINKIELSHNNIIFNTTIIKSSPDRCSYSNTLTIPINEITDTNGLTVVTLTAYDNFNHQSSKTAQFNYDTQPPIINSDSLQIKNSRGEIIEYIKDSPIPVTITFTITPDITDDLNTNNVYADISKLNTDYPLGFKKKAVCSQLSSGVYECAIRNIQVKLSRPTGSDYTIVPITIEAYDLAGNMEPVLLTKTIYYDNIGPSLTSIRTDKSRSGINYVGSLTTFIVELEEAGSGIYAENIKLDLSSITGESNKKADRCEQSGTTWACYWDNIIYRYSDGEKTISILSSSSDKLGNVVTSSTGSLSTTVIADRTPPAVISSEVSGVPTGANIPALVESGYIKTTDHVKITANIREKNGFSSAYADFNSIVTTQRNVSTTGCNLQGDNLWVCKFESDSIDVPGYINTNIPLTFTDIVGNSISYRQPIVVYNYSDETHPSYWTHIVSCSPSLVDRQITNLIGYKVMCSISLIPLTSPQETISIGFDRCVDNIQGSTAYISSADLINKGRGSTNPYLSFTLTKTDMRINQISVNCPLSIYTKAGNDITKFPEIENVTVSIGLYNMPLGEFDKSVEQKIKDVEDEIAVGWEWVGSLKKLLFYLEKICSILDLLNKLQILFGILEQIKPIGEIFRGPSQVIEKYATGQDTHFYKFCKYISCDKTLWGDWYTGQRTKWLDETAPSGRSGAAGGDREVGEWENFFRKYDLGTMWPETPKDSIVLSIATGCIPGIIYNIEKWRQVQCNYGVCLWDSAENHVPISTCNEQKSYLECKFVVGEILQWLPFNWFKTIGQRVAYILSDPLSLLFGFFGMFCPNWSASAHGACAILRGATLVSEIAGDIDSMFDSQNWKIQGDMCEEYFDRLDELEEGGEISV